LQRGGYLDTQDIASVVAQAYGQITHRIEDVIKSDGEWVSSLDIESMILQRQGVCKVAVIGVKDEKWGERRVTPVVLKPGYDAPVSEDCIRKCVLYFSETGQAANTRFRQP